MNTYPCVLLPFLNDILAKIGKISKYSEWAAKKKYPHKAFRTLLCGIDSDGMLISAVHEEDGHEGLHLLMVDPHIPAGAKLY